MSAGAVGVEKRFLVSNNNNGNNNSGKNTYECINVDTNYILRDINAFKKARKRNVRNIYEDGTYIDDAQMLSKKAKVESFLDIKSEDDSIVSLEEEGEGDDIHITSDASNENQNEKGVSDNNKNNSAHGVMENGDHTFCEPNSNEALMHENEICAKDQAIIEENEKKMTQKIDMCIDNVLENMRSCNEIGEAKRIMTSILNNFIRNNFVYVENYKDNPVFVKSHFDTLHKEKRILKSALKWQYQMIKQLQKIIDNQKLELKKNNDELNQIKAKVHQYFYEVSNPNKETFQPYIYPDVY